MFYFRTRIKADQPPILFGDSSTVSKYRNEKKNKTREKKVNIRHVVTLKLPWVTKKEFLLTISIQYQPDKRSE